MIDLLKYILAIILMFVIFIVFIIIAPKRDKIEACMMQYKDYEYCKMRYGSDK